MWRMVALLGRTALLLGVGAALGIVINAARADGVSMSARTATPTSCTAAPAIPLPSATGAPPVEVLPPNQAVGLCGDPRTLLADVRDAGEFAEGHVSGAIHLPCAASGTAAAAAVQLLDGRRTLIVYGRGTDDAKVVADEMRARIASPEVRVLVLAGGFPAWNAAGLACSSGPCTDCRAPQPGHK